MQVILLPWPFWKFQGQESEGLKNGQISTSGASWRTHHLKWPSPMSGLPAHLACVGCPYRLYEPAVSNWSKETLAIARVSNPMISYVSPIANTSNLGFILAKRTVGSRIRWSVQIILKWFELEKYAVRCFTLWWTNILQWKDPPCY